MSSPNDTPDNERGHQPSQLLRQSEWDANRQVRERIRIGYEELDADTFEQFLLLPDVDLADPRLIDEFLRRYVGTFDDVELAAFDHLNRAGWIMAGAGFLAPDQSRDGRLHWDWKRVTEHLRMSHHVIEQGERVHVFTKSTTK